MLSCSLKLRLMVLLCVAWGPRWASASAPDTRALLAASGVPPARVDHYAARIEQLCEAFQAEDQPAGDATDRARSVHAFLHERVLRGTYEASASDLGAALDGGPFNCAAASALFLTLATCVGLDTQAVSVPGHVWCRVRDERSTCDVETTCRDWFEIAARYKGEVSDKRSPAMAAHYDRVAAGRILSHREFLAVFHYNQGVTLLRERRFAAAARANLRALELDPLCRPAQENLAAAAKHAGAANPPRDHSSSGG